MRKIIERLFDLQFFADGVSGEAAGESTAPGATAPVAGEQTTGDISPAAGESTQTRSLEELGVPRAKAERYRAIKSRRGENTKEAEPAAAEPESQPTAQQDAAAEPQQEKQQTAEPPDWDELMKIPELNRRMQETVKAGKKAVQARFDGVVPILELLGRKYGVDTTDIGKLDIKGLAQKVGEDSYFYEEYADTHGLDTEQAKSAVQRELAQNVREREIARRENELSETLEEIMARRHQEKLATDAAKLKAVFPEFDLAKEMQNPRFAAMVSPNGGWGVEDAFWAIHHREIEQVRAAQTANHVAQALSKSVQYGREIPAENGGRNSSAAPIEEKLYSRMTREERQAYKARLQREAAARR